MRRILKINDDWKFTKSNVGVNSDLSENGITVTLPHTWNDIDGQDGGNDYYRGTCWYAKSLEKPLFHDDEEVWLEFRGVAMSADVYVNGQLLAHHEGGYSTFRVNITDVLLDRNVIEVSADNSSTDKIYPQRADFTFYGGIYRDVYLVIVPKVHFELNYYGGSGVKVSPKVNGENAVVQVEAWTENAADGTMISVSIDGLGEVNTTVHNNKAEAVLVIENVRLWNGVKDPFQYNMLVEMPEHGDAVSVKFGCRTYEFDAKKGFILNGKTYPLRGVSRHQDYKGIGNAITQEMQKEDMKIIAEMGANTIRLAHYQHDQYFYDLCDEYGMIVWAEIPYITEHQPAGRENTFSQMKDLIAQNYNHPSIICWGLSNEITVAGMNDDLLENHKLLNELVHKMDSTRPSAMANVFLLETDSELLNIPDILSYNLYYGWYVGEPEDNDAWFDTFHSDYPDRIIGLSEYGADATIQFQTGSPKRGDYTEQYQAVYHEHMMKMLENRPYIWASHVWNMFDFGADGRDEGGEKGVNHKGLVTFDRKIKKDAFYLYKAYLSDEPFVHLCGSRYIDREEEETLVKVYSNQEKVILYCDGIIVAEKEGNKVFEFLLSISGEHEVEARSGTLYDCIKIKKVDKPNESYILEDQSLTNWFENIAEGPEGYFSIRDTIKDIKKVPESRVVFERFQEFAAATFGDVAKNVKISKEMQDKMDALTFEANIKQVGKSITQEMVISINKELNRIKKNVN